MSLRPLSTPLFVLATILPSGCFKGDLAELPCYLDSECDPLKCVGGQCGDAAKSRPVALAAGSDHTCVVLGSGGVRCWGSNLGRQLGDPDLEASTCNDTPPGEDIDFGPGAGAALRVAASVSATGDEEGHAHTCALFANGRVKCWGAGFAGTNSGWLGYENSENVVDPASVGFVPLPHLVRELAIGDRYSCVIYEDGGLACWGSGNKPIVRPDDDHVGDAEGEISGLGTIALGGDGRVLSISPGYLHACAVREDSTAWCWGANSYGQGGGGDYFMEIDEPRAVKLAQPAKLVDVHAGYYHSCGLLADNKIACWGCNEKGELGVPDDHPALVEGGDCFVRMDAPNARGLSSPLLSSLVNAVIAGRQVTQLVSGHHHNCVLLDDHSIYCWGDNEFSQLGGDVEQGLPVAVKIDSIDDSQTPVRLASGGSHTCALMSSGDVYCWGDNSHGQLGAGDCKQTKAPRKVKL